MDTVDDSLLDKYDTEFVGTYYDGYYSTATPPVFSGDGTALYHADWLKSYPAKAGQYEEAEVVVINKEEYMVYTEEGFPIAELCKCFKHNT